MYLIGLCLLPVTVCTPTRNNPHAKNATPRLYVSVCAQSLSLHTLIYFFTNGLALQEKDQTNLLATDLGNPLSPNSTFEVGDGVMSHSSYQVLSVNSTTNVYISAHTNPIMSKYGKLASQVSHHAGIMRVFENMRKTMNEKLLTLRFQKTNFNSFYN